MPSAAAEVALAPGSKSAEGYGGGWLRLQWYRFGCNSDGDLSHEGEARHLGGGDGVVYLDEILFKIKRGRKPFLLHVLNESGFETSFISMFITHVLQLC